jgi:hypothetical protein
MRHKASGDATHPLFDISTVTSWTFPRQTFIPTHLRA